MTLYLIMFLLASFAFETFVEVLNLSKINSVIPDIFKNVYSDEKYRKAQSYLKTNTIFGLIQGCFSALLLIFAVTFGFFEILDLFLRQYILSEELRGLVFVGGVAFAGQIFSLPFSVWHTFVIEEKFGFNKTTAKTFVVDLLKGWTLSVVVGAPIFYLFLKIWNSLGSQAWIWAWLFLVCVQLFMMFVAPVTIMPLFNKFQPLPDGELKKAIEDYAQKADFKMKGIFTMDGSKRSTKANAYFTGFGRFRRIVLFDTLIQKHTKEELLAILAHEVGHFKLKHIFRQLFLSLAVSALTLFLMSLFASHPLIFEAFQMSQVSSYAGLLFFGILYSPISTILSMYSLFLSRKYEFEADEYSRQTYGNPVALREALIKLSSDSLSNLYPHPLKVFLEYTHPPIIQRLDRLV